MFVGAIAMERPDTPLLGDQSGAEKSTVLAMAQSGCRGRRFAQAVREYGRSLSNEREAAGADLRRTWGVHDHALRLNGVGKRSMSARNQSDRLCIVLGLRRHHNLNEYNPSPLDFDGRLQATSV